MNDDNLFYYVILVETVLFNGEVYFHVSVQLLL